MLFVLFICLALVNAEITKQQIVVPTVQQQPVVSAPSSSAFRTAGEILNNSEPVVPRAVVTGPPILLTPQTLTPNSTGSTTDSRPAAVAAPPSLSHSIPTPSVAKSGNIASIQQQMKR